MYRALILKTDRLVNQWDNSEQAIGKIVLLDDYDIGVLNKGQSACPENNKYQINFIKSDFQILDFRYYVKNL